MNNYNKGTFQNTYDGGNGDAIWEFLNSERAVTMMETATYLYRPAVEPLSNELEQRFGSVVREDRVKQMIGHMVRQIVEARGYRVDRNNVKIRREDNIFKRGTRYIA